MARTAILSAFFLLPHAAIGDVVCSGPTLCFDYELHEPVSESIAMDVRTTSDEYIRILLAEDFEESERFWHSDATSGMIDSKRPHRIRRHLGFDIEHLETAFRQVFSVPEVNGQEGYFVVVEYGTRTGNFDVLHFVAWVVEDGRWRVACHKFVHRCPPDSTPIKLSPNKSLHWPPGGPCHASCKGNKRARYWRQ